MANAYKDENGVSTLIAASNADGLATVRVLADPSSHSLVVSDGTTGSNNGNNGNNATRDQNNVPVLIAVSSADGFTPVEVYADPATGALLIDSQ